MTSKLAYLTFFYFFSKKVIILFVFSQKTFIFATEIKKLLVHKPITKK